MGVRNENVVSAVDDVGAFGNGFQFIDIERASIINLSSNFTIITFNNFQSFRNSGSRERVRSSSKSNTRGNSQNFNIRLVRNNKSTIRRQSLRENTTDKVASTIHVEVFFNSVSSGSKRTQRVSFIHHNFSIKFITKFTSTRQVSNSTISRVNRINNQQDTSRILVAVFFHQFFESIVVLVGELDNLSTSQFTSVSQTNVTFLIQKDQSTLGAQVRNQVHTGQETRSGERAIFSLKEGLHSIVGLINNSILSKKKIASVITSSRLTNFVESIFSDFFINMESPVAQGRHQDALVVITFNVDVVTIRFLVKGNSRGISPVFFDHLDIVSSKNNTGNINRTFHSSLVLDNRLRATDRMFNQTTSHIQMGKVLETFSFNKKLLGHLVHFEFLLQVRRRIGDE
mmetsp:Transcript_25583/g.35466  ORF Transcript_25583/g.35466 Transcript_25583/m.35466 type:complete len:399 (+) Transcript_25583:475-1671(+)